jgi:hypothetical protein
LEKHELEPIANTAGSAAACHRKTKLAVFVFSSFASGVNFTQNQHKMMD